VNISLNVLLVPVYGLIAAGISTFVALSIQCLGVYREGYKTLPVSPPLATIGVCLVAAVAALLAATSVRTGYGLGDLFAVGSVSSLTYVAVLLTLSSSLRSDFIRYLRNRLTAA
ncbi:MAG: polysaccharide biosynthesis C-terminal domain-containing protein, partial [Pseudomonadota bacterium]